MEGQESSGDQESSESEDTQQPEEEQKPVAPVKEKDDKPAKSDDQPPEDSAEAGESESDSGSPGQTDEVVEDEPVPDKQDEDKAETSEDEEKEEPETVQSEEEPEAEPVEDVQAAEKTVDETEQGDAEEAAPADAEPKAEPEPDEDEPHFDKGIFAIKTSIGHEKMVADTLESRIRRRKADVYSIMLPPNLRGYLLIEALDNREALRDLIKGVQHARTIVEGTTTIEEIEGFLTPKPIVAGIEEGDIVEVIAGPFKGEKAKVKQIDLSKEEITIELFEAMVSIPVTIRGDHVRVLEKESS